MTIGASIIDYSIKYGVKARMEDDGSQKYHESSIREENYIHYYPLIDNMDEDAIIEGTSVDLRVDKIYRLFSTQNIVIAKDYRIMPRIEELQLQSCFYHTNNDKNFYELFPGTAFIATTMEIINMPDNMVAFPIQRMTMPSCGLSVGCGVVQPNFYGPLKFGVVNNMDASVFIERGSRLITLVFDKINGLANIYNGYHQGGTQISSNGQKAPPR